MTPDDAKALILREGLGEHGLPVTLRMGDDPGAERVGAILVSLRVLFDELRGRAAVDRTLACALFSLAYHTEAMTNVRNPSRVWRDTFLDLERLRIVAAVESIFADDWVEWVSPGRAAES